jgi:hypothetical protein
MARGFYGFAIAKARILTDFFYCLFHAVTSFLSFRGTRNLREKLDKDWAFVTELLVKISPPSK